MRLPLVFALAALAAGCIGPDSLKKAEHPAVPPPTTDPAPPAPPSPPAVNVTRYNGSVAGAWAPGVAYFAASGTHVFDLNVTNATRALVVEVSWKGAGHLSLKLDVPAKYCAQTDPLGFLVECPSPKPNDAGTSPARIVVTDRAALDRVGTWQIGVWAQDSTSEVPFTVAASRFAEGPPPAAGYSALPPS